VITLVIEAATYAGSVALLADGKLIGQRTVAMRGRDSEALMPAVDLMLRDAGVQPHGLSRVVCGAGPGAFTSLRIAGGIAKGLALALNIPLVPVSSLALIVASRRTLTPGVTVAAIDAMRGEHYVQLYRTSADGIISEEGPVSLWSSARLAARAAELGAVVTGPSGRGEHAVTPHARGAAQLAPLIAATRPADLASWEPAYGRLAEAQVKWEAEHGRPLIAG
jgi:universal bacterial protein YeaZ